MAKLDDKMDASMVNTSELKTLQIQIHLPVSHAREFRLIKLHAAPEGSPISCELRHYKIHNAPPFRALSYTWASPFESGERNTSKETEAISVDGKHLSVGKNLADALKALRDWHGGNSDYVWADAVCINQSSYKERGEQVAMMGDIYSQAESLFAWLGPEAQDSDRALGFVETLAIDRRSSRSGALTLEKAKNPSYREHWKALAALMDRRWWSRAWILQETVLARRVHFSCGKKMVSGTDIFDASGAMEDVWDQLYNFLDNEYGVKLNVPTSNVLDGMSRLLSARLNGDLYPMLTCHYRTMSSLATDPRDYVFAKLGLASDGHVVQPDYKQSVSQVYCNFVRNQIEDSHSLDIIHFDARPRTTEDLPSWVPDWSASYGANPVQPEPSPDGNSASYSASSGLSYDIMFSIDTRRLLCQGYQFDTVDGLAYSEESGWAGYQEPRPASQPRTTECAYVSAEKAFEALWRSLIANQMLDGSIPQAEVGLILARSACDFEAQLTKQLEGSITSNPSRFEKYYRGIRDFLVCAKTVKEWMQWAVEGVPAVSSDIQDMDIQRCMVNALYYRRLITTRRGYIGTAPYETNPGDAVCLLWGSSLPVILRPSDQSVVIGAAYVHGTMYGEGIGLLDREQAAIQQFDLY